MNHDQQSWTYPNQVDAIRHSFPSVALGLLSQRWKWSVIPWRYLWSNLLLLRYLPVLLLQLSGFSFSYCFLQDSTSRCIFHVLSYTLPVLPDIWGNLWWKKIWMLSSEYGIVLRLGGDMKKSTEVLNLTVVHWYWLSTVPFKYYLSWIFYSVKTCFVSYLL